MPTKSERPPIAGIVSAQCGSCSAAMAFGASHVLSVPSAVRWEAWSLTGRLSGLLLQVHAGKVVECGTKEELLARKGHYYRRVSAQARPQS